mgnify:FL=1
MGEAGVLGEGVDGGAVGWRQMQTNAMEGGGVGVGVGILQL